MADGFEGKMQKFLNDLLATLPQEVTIAQEIDVNGLQQGLAKSIQDSFDQRYQGAEQEIKKRVEDMGREAEAKAREIGKSQEAKQQELKKLLEEVKGQQDEQGNLIQQIEKAVGRKSEELANSHNHIREEIEQMRRTIAQILQQTNELNGQIQQKQMKAVIQGDIDTEGNGRVKLTVLNLKAYCLENCILRFYAGNEAYCDSGVMEPAVLGGQVSEVTAMLPAELQPNITYQVAIFRGDKAISNYVQFLV
jgi:hypothetical protein